ncbi:MAG TPA: head GIN domain-containing protein [Flavitalea sp.]|nr:head GIN domain-containing protein [Flavitalea sp.]
MKKILSIITFSLLVVCTNAQQINDPNVEVRQLKGFNSIKISNAIDLYLSQGTEEAVAVSADKVSLRNHIKTSVEGGVLKIWYENTGDGFKFGNRKLKAYVSVKNLIRLQASGASDVVIAGKLTGNDLSIEMNGASDIKGNLDLKSLDLKLNGASDATISGKVVTLKIDANGASDLKGYELETDNCTAEASGASDIKITVNKELSARASGASGVYYKGSGVIRDIKTSGASSISKKG